MQLETNLYVLKEKAIAVSPINHATSEIQWDLDTVENAWYGERALYWDGRPYSPATGKQWDLWQVM